jgi:hypothetical protein
VIVCVVFIFDSLNCFYYFLLATSGLSPKDLLEILNTCSLSKVAAENILLELDKISFDVLTSLQLKPDFLIRSLNQISFWRSLFPNSNESGSSLSKKLIEIRAVLDVSKTTVIQKKEEEQHLRQQNQTDMDSKNLSKQTWAPQKIRELLFNILKASEETDKVLFISFADFVLFLIAQQSNEQKKEQMNVLISFFEQITKPTVNFKNVHRLGILFRFLLSSNTSKQEKAELLNKWKQISQFNSKANQQTRLILENELITKIFSGTCTVDWLYSSQISTNKIMFLDWLNIVLPDQWNEFLLNLIFGKTESEKTNYLMAMNIHHSSWKELNRIFDWIFSSSFVVNKEKRNQTYVGVLDWLTAFLNHARSWYVLTSNLASSDKRTLKFSSRDFNEKSIIMLTDWILIDLSNNCVRETEDLTRKSILQSPRFDLLRMCLENELSLVFVVVKHIQSQQNLKSVVILSVLQHLYLSFPQIRSFLNPDLFKFVSQSVTQLTSKVLIFFLLFFFFLFDFLLFISLINWFIF